MRRATVGNSLPGRCRPTGSKSSPRIGLGTCFRPGSEGAGQSGDVSGALLSSARPPRRIDQAAGEECLGASMSVRNTRTISMRGHSSRPRHRLASQARLRHSKPGTAGGERPAKLPPPGIGGPRRTACRELPNWPRPPARSPQCEAGRPFPGDPERARNGTPLRPSWRAGRETRGMRACRTHRRRTREDVALATRFKDSRRGHGVAAVLMPGSTSPQQGGAGDLRIARGPHGAHRAPRPAPRRRPDRVARRAERRTAPSARDFDCAMIRHRPS